MRTVHVALVLAALLVPAIASAQDDDLAPDPETAMALSADQRAQGSLDGFRSYLERVRANDAGLYQLLDPRLDALEERSTIADVVFWTGTILAVAALGVAIPVHEEVGLDPALGLIIGGVSTFVVAVVIQAFLRPGHSDLVALIDLHDHRLGRR